VQDGSCGRDRNDHLEFGHEGNRQRTKSIQL
jgi:hypothetical protein